jgi:hypothetical protein
MKIRRISFWLGVISIGLFIFAPALVLQYAEQPQEMPLWIRLLLKLNAVVLTVSFLYLWIDAWRRLFRFWDAREKKKNYVLLFFMIFASPLAAIHFYFRREETGAERQGQAL